MAPQWLLSNGRLAPLPVQYQNKDTKWLQTTGIFKPSRSSDLAFARTGGPVLRKCYGSPADTALLAGDVFS